MIESIIDTPLGSDFHSSVIKRAWSYLTEICIFPQFRLATLVDMAPENKKARLYMLGDFIKGQNKEIKDPYNVSTFLFFGFTDRPTDTPQFGFYFQSFFILCAGRFKFISNLLWEDVHCMRGFLLSYQWKETLTTLNLSCCCFISFSRFSFFLVAFVDVMKMNKNEYFCINYGFFVRENKEWQSVIKLKFKHLSDLLISPLRLFPEWRWFCRPISLLNQIIKLLYYLVVDN